MYIVFSVWINLFQLEKAIYVYLQFAWMVLCLIAHPLFGL